MGKQGINLLILQLYADHTWNVGVECAAVACIHIFALKIYILIVK